MSDAYIKEPERDVPVACDVDVAVAGGGLSGVFAAAAAARHGASTVIIDRFGQIGGNIGPGMICGGGIHGPQDKPLLDSLEGLRREFCARVMELGGVCHGWYGDIQMARDSNIMSYVAFEMLKSAGVELMLSTYITDPILEGRKVCGVFIENKSGRRAVKAGVVVDATGEADIARKAGAPIIYPKYDYHEMDKHAPTGMGGWYLVGGVDWLRYDEFLKAHPKADAEDVEWADRTMKPRYRQHITRQGEAILPLVRKAWESGEFRAVQEIDGLGHVATGLYSSPDVSAGTVGCMVRVGSEFYKDDKEGEWSDVMNAGDGDHISKAETAFRMFVFEEVQFRRKYVPGFENAYLITVSPFLGARGGPCIEGEHVRTKEDAGERFEDEIRPGIPYRVLLPKDLDGVIAVGRSASSIPDTALRGRTTAMMTGVIGGIAAALAVKAGVTPKALDVKRLQQALTEEGLFPTGPGR